MLNKIMRFSHISLLLIFTVLVVMTGCVFKSPLAEKNPVTVLGTLQGDQNENIEDAQVILTKGKHSVKETVPISNNMFEATLKAPIGQWELSVILVDKEGMALFQSKAQTINVTGRKPISINLILRPADSIVLVRIDLDNYIFKDKVMRARIHFDEEVYEVIRDNVNDGLEKEISLSPGSYEFKIELYTESFRAGDKLGVGVWKIIKVEKNEEKTITWQPEMDEIIISGQVETLLPAPENLRYTLEDTDVIITWDPLPYDELAGYFVLVQKDPQERFEILNSTPLTECTFAHELEDDYLVDELLYLVAGVTDNGLVGFYSEQLILNP